MRFRKRDILRTLVVRTNDREPNCRNHFGDSIERVSLLTRQPVSSTGQCLGRDSNSRTEIKHWGQLPPESEAFSEEGLPRFTVFVFRTPVAPRVHSAGCLGIGTRCATYPPFLPVVAMTGSPTETYRLSPKPPRFRRFGNSMTTQRAWPVTVNGTASNLSENVRKSMVIY